LDTEADGDVLTLEGVRAAVELGSRLEGGYEVLVSTGAQRATQTLGCFLAGLGETVRRGLVVEPGLRSGVEDRWRAAYDKAGNGALQALREADPDVFARITVDVADLGDFVLVSGSAGSVKEVGGSGNDVLKAAGLKVGPPASFSVVKAMTHSNARAASTDSGVVRATTCSRAAFTGSTSRTTPSEQPR
jgi:hypothetical protein